LPKLPVVSGRETVRALERGGFVMARQEDSHHTLKHVQRRRRPTVTVHGSQDLPIGTLRAILRQAGLTVEEFIALLD